jgi:hypothetical protein
MSHRSAALFIAVSLLSARVEAQDDRERYEAEVCNEGRISVDVAVAYTDFGFVNEFFQVHGWQVVRPGECKTVFSHLYAPQNWLSFQSFPLHLAFGFEDSTGVWGAARVAPPDWDDAAPSRAQLCVTKDGFSYEVIAEDPQRTCTGAGEFLIPASILWEPTSPTSVYGEWNQVLGGPARFTVALGPSDRANPLGPRASTPPPVRGPGTSSDFQTLLMSTMTLLPESERTFGPGGYEDLKLGYRWVFVCVDPALEAKEATSDPLAPRSRAIVDAVRKQLAAHEQGLLRMRLAEANGVITAQPIAGETGDCVDAGEREYVFQSLTRQGARLQFRAFLTEILQGPGAPAPILFASPWAITAKDISMNFCLTESAVEKSSSIDPHSAGAQALRTALRRFLASHQFRILGNSRTDLDRGVKVTEADGRFVVAEVSECENHPPVFYALSFAGQEIGEQAAPASSPAPLTRSAPAVTPAPQTPTAPDPEPGFGNLMGEGGFIQPLPEQ